ncbi:hypothetical protein [Deinococcus soli (ex Cha et al. 2016)]|uniref:hypothetical protein n=1 Tax=Deinococcus soli (ex Cha et al. 2016) TaxID=1309411 RepID=UPI001666742D|nr:hypothetical protein [Deinococcus soli (ex Cha et al. 2016)]GGB81261.1 hypothetical protein GCM10008019_41890 [Deinococcus soli (ex Cha et al. 2016)]
MAPYHPQLRFHIDTAQKTADITAQFSEVDDYNLGQLSDDRDLVSTVHATMPTLEDRAQQLLDQYWTNPLHTSDPSNQLDVLIRVVEANWCPRHPELNGVQGQWDATPTPKILLLCAVPDPERLTARFIHEFGHYLDWTQSGSHATRYMAGFLRAETAAELLVAQHLGLSALTHNTVCPPDARANIHRLLAAEGDLNDQAAQEESFEYFEVHKGESGYDRRQRVQNAYALANELVRTGRWTFGKLLRMDDQAFRSALLSSPDLWLETVRVEQA